MYPATFAWSVGIKHFNGKNNNQSLLSFHSYFGYLPKQFFFTAALAIILAI